MGNEVAAQGAARAHSRLSPSAASRWVVCPGSVSMCERYPDTGRSEAAEEGTASHFVAEQVLLRGIAAHTLLNTPAPNGIIINEEMIEGAMVYVQAVRDATLAAPPPAGMTHVEHRLCVESVHPSCFGTADLTYYVPQIAELHVWDYKYGYGIVDPYENYQLIIYAIGAIEKLAAVYNMGYGDLDQRISVTMHIAQPRPYHPAGPVREWRIPATDLRPYINRLARAATLALADNPECATGSHCHYCRARHACPALHRAAMLSVDYMLMAHPEELLPEAMAAEIRTLRRAAEMIKYRLDALETRAVSTLQAGGAIPGFRIEPGRGHLKWKVPAEQIFALGDMYGVDLRAEPQAITPAKARAKRLPEEVITAMAEQPVTGIKLVPWTLERVFGKQ